MNTKVKTYVRDKKTIVLIGVMHIGSTSYYNKIQKALDNFNPNTVLYEGVKMTKKSIIDKYKLIADTLDLTYQKEAIKYNNEWAKSDLDYEILKSANGGELNIVKNMNQLDEDVVESIQENKKIVRFVGLLMIKVLLPISRLKKDDPVILTLRNSKVILDMFEVLKNNDTVCGFYGDRHLSGIEKYIKKVGFKLHSIEKMNPLK